MISSRYCASQSSRGSTNSPLVLAGRPLAAIDVRSLCFLWKEPSTSSSHAAARLAQPRPSPRARRRCRRPLAPFRSHIDHQPPIGCGGGFDLTEPVKGIICDFNETPAREFAGFGRAFLHDVFAARTANLLTEHTAPRIEPGNPPRGNDGIVDSQRRAVPIAGDRK